MLAEYYCVILLKCSTCYIEVQLVKFVVVVVVVVVVMELKCMVNGMDSEVCCVSVSSECYIIYCRNLLSCKAALQQLYCKKRYRNNLE